MKKILNIAIVAVMVLSMTAAYAQQEAHYSLYKYNLSVINPAATAVDGTKITSDFRSQWVGLPQAPETQTFTFGTSVGDKMGLGFSVINDKVHIISETQLYVDYSYKLELNEGSNLYLGLKAGGSFLNIDVNALGIINDALLSNNVSTFNPNVGIGAYYKTNKYFLSLAIPRLLSNDRYEMDNNTISLSGTDKMHMYFGGGYTYAIGKNIDLTPSFMTRFTSGAPMSLDLTATAKLYKKFELGINYRLNESIGFVSMMRAADWMKIGYAYESTTSDIQNYSRGTHEVMMIFNLSKKDK
jgi:type IX secretion system PorP/SprF family membrane protein